ncbi:MAG: GatB/YqeY domain-containing protein [Patescibacteria group bacterium]
MNLYQQIQEDIKNAMRNHDMETLNILRVTFSSLKNKAIEVKKELEDADAMTVIKSDLKKLEDALGDFTKAAREDLIAQTQKEIAILKAYLPPEMSDEELKTKIEALLAELGVSDLADMGKAMKASMEQLRGQVDGGRVKKMIEELLKK